MKNWKTTLAGLGAAFLQLLAGGMTAKNAAAAVGLAAIGASAPPGLALISAANCWISFVTPDGSTVWVPGWK